MIIEDFTEIDELDDETPIESITGEITNLYPPKDGQYPKQWGKMVDEDGVEAFFCLANESKFMDSDEWEGETVTFMSQKQTSGRAKGKLTGVKIKEGEKGNSIWVTNTAIIEDEAGDEIKTGNSSSNRSGKRSSRDRSSGRRDKKGGRGKATEEGIHVNELLNQLTEVTVAAFDIYKDKGCDDDVAATLASGTASAVAHWWFGSKAPAGIQDLVSHEKPTKKTNKRRRPRKKEAEYDEDEDDDDIPF